MSEFVFAFFLNSGVLKGNLNFWPDITALSLGLSLILTFRQIAIKRGIPNLVIKPAIIYLLLAGFILLSVGYSAAGTMFALEKALRFLIITGWSFIGVQLIVNSESAVRKFFNATLLLSYYMGFLSVYEYVQNRGLVGSIRVGGADYIALGKACGVGILILICLHLYDKKPGFIKFLVIVGSIGLFTFAVFISGGRMPVISLFLSLLVLVPFSIKFRKPGWLIINSGLTKLLAVTCVIGVVAIPIINTGAFEYLFLRFQLLTTQGGGNSIINRFNRMDTALDIWGQNAVLGDGIASFPINYHGFDIENEYPHNIILELLAETGVIGLTLFLTLFGYSLWQFYRSVHKKGMNQYRLLIFTFFVYMFLSANVSGDINSNRLFFTALGLLCVSPLLIKGQVQQAEPNP